MKLSRNSLSFRSVNLIHTRLGSTTYTPKSLCGHFWTTLSMGAFFYALPVGLIGAYILGWILAPLETAMYSGAFVGAIALLFGIVFFGEKYSKHRKANRKIKIDTGPGLVKSFMKARKRNVCPLIELTD